MDLEEQEVQETKTFTQEEVNKIVQDRIAREKNSYADYGDLKETAEALKTYYGANSTQEVKDIVRNAVEQNKKQQELQDLQQEAQSTGTSPELLADIKALKVELAELKKDKQEAVKQAESKKKADEAWSNQVSEFDTKYSEKGITAEKLAEDQKFFKFFQRSNPSLSLSEVYEDYVELVGGAESAAIQKIKSNVDRSTSSGKSKGTADGGTYGLSSNQQELAKENGMSNKEYAELLSNIRR